MVLGVQRRRIAPLLALTAALHAWPAATAPRTGLTGAAGLARIYDAVFDARFDQVPALLRRACGDSVGPDTVSGAPGRGSGQESAAAASSERAPREACQLLEVMALWWQIQLDPLDRSLDARFEAEADAAIAAIDAWAVREPERAEAHFYLGGAYGVRAQFRVLRGERLAAARDGKRIKEALERALALDPGMRDAYFGIGLYHYYADVAPAAAKVLRWLLALPGGDRRNGLREMLEARASGRLLRSEADYQLHTIYLWYEKQPERAHALLAALAERHPYNPHFRQRLAEVEDVYLHDPVASLRTWEQLLDDARRRRVARPDMVEALARLGAARQLDRLFETDRAIEHLRAVVAARPASPVGALAFAHLRLGEYLDRLGQRTEAIAAYRAALAAAPDDDDGSGVREQARQGLRRTPDASHAAAYRLSLEGWRALERNDAPSAARLLGQALAIEPGDPVTLYRYARLQLARGEIDDALTTLAAIHARQESTPAEIYQHACLDAARVHEARGATSLAIDLYRASTTVFGGDRALKARARRALARLTL